MYSAVMGWMASLTTTLRTSAEADVARRKSRAKSAAAQRGGFMTGHLGRSVEKSEPELLGLKPIIKKRLTAALKSCASPKADFSQTCFKNCVSTALSYAP